MCIHSRPRVSLDCQKRSRSHLCSKLPTRCEWANRSLCENVNEVNIVYCIVLILVASGSFRGRPILSLGPYTDNKLSVTGWPTVNGQQCQRQPGATTTHCLQILSDSSCLDLHSMGDIPSNSSLRKVNVNKVDICSKWNRINSTCLLFLSLSTLSL